MKSYATTPNKQNGFQKKTDNLTGSTVTNPQSTRKDVQQIVTDFMISRLEEGVIPWQMPFQNAFIAQNYVSKRAYRGINTLLLASFNFENPFFLTFEQIKTLGGMVKKGQKGIPVVFWKMLDKKDEVQSGSQDEENKGKPMLKYYYVWNVEQTEGIEFKFPEPLVFTEADTIIAGENIYNNMPQKPVLKHSKKVQAFYSPLEDYVHLPKKEYFKTNHDYYATLFHELVHSTGHKSRLNREEIESVSFFGDEVYSKEELTAEVGAAFLCAEIHIDTFTVLNNSASYIQSWLRELKNDKTLIMKAVSKAQRAVDFILGISYEAKETPTVAPIVIPEAEQVEDLLLVETEAEELVF